MTMTQLPPTREFPPERRAATRELLELVAEESLRTRRPRSWRRRWLSRTGVLALAGAIFTTGGVATAYVAFRSADSDTSVYCYSRVDDEQGSDFPGTEVSGEAQDSKGSKTRLDPVRTCADLWRQGVIEHGADNAGQPDGRTHRVPSLRACVVEDGTAAVYPTSDPRVCERLGLPRLKP